MNNNFLDLIKNSRFKSDLEEINKLNESDRALVLNCRNFEFNVVMPRLNEINSSKESGIILKNKIIELIDIINTDAPVKKYWGNLLYSLNVLLNK